MNSIFGNLIYVCKEIWTNIGISQKVSIIMLLLVSVGVIGVLSYVGMRPNWHVVYADEDVKTIAAISEIAEEAGIEVSVRDFGRTLAVPRNKVEKLRMLVNKQDNLVVGNSRNPYETGSSKPWVGDDERTELSIKRRQWDHAQSIKKITGAIWVDVVIVPPSKGAFRSADDQTGKARVVLKTKNGKMLTKNQVQSIRHIVGDGESISPDMVTVICNDEPLYIASSNTDISGLENASKQLAFINMQERTMEEKVIAILSKRFGHDGVSVKASIDVDFDEFSVTEKVYMSDSSGVELQTKETDKTHKVEKETTGSGEVTVKVADNNKKLDSDIGTTVNTEKTTIKSRPSSRIKSIRSTGPRIIRKAVAVLITLKSDDPLYLGSKGEGKDKKEPDAATKQAHELALKAKKAELSELIKCVVGRTGAKLDVAKGEAANSTKNDTMVVVEFAFAPETAKDKLVNATPSGFMALLQKYSTVPVARPVFGFFLLLFLYKVFGSTFRKGEVESVDLGSRTTLVGEGASYDGGGTTAGGMGNDELSDISLPVPMDQVRTQLASDPSYVAGTLEAWLSSDKK